MRAEAQGVRANPQSSLRRIEEDEGLEEEEAAMSTGSRHSAIESVAVGEGED